MDKYSFIQGVMVGQQIKGWGSANGNFLSFVKIEITTPPDQIVYAVGDFFNPTGMVVTATYFDGSNYLEVVINDYQYEPIATLTSQDNKIIVSVTDMGITRQALQKITVKDSDKYLTFSSSSNFQMWTVAAAKTWDGTIYFSLDKISWEIWNGERIQAQNGKIYMRGKNNHGIHASFRFNDDTRCRGDISALLDFMSEAPPAIEPYAFENLFNTAYLISAPTLSLLNLEAGCYKGMFQGSYITKAPELPAQEVKENCYEAMFKGCRKLRVMPPSLPATTLAKECYKSMFESAGVQSSQMISPPSLPARRLAEGCYARMFYDSRLRWIPSLPATYLPRNCYLYMFVEARGPSGWVQIAPMRNSEYRFPFRLPSSGQGYSVQSDVVDNMFSGIAGFQLNTSYYASIQVK